MPRIVFSEFMSIYNMMKNDRDEWSKSSEQPPLEVDDEENIEIQADFMFKNEKDYPPLDTEQQDVDLDDAQAPGASNQLLEPKSYPADRTAEMKVRAQAELTASARFFPSTWSLKQHELKKAIESLTFFADEELNSLLIRVLQRGDCQHSPSRAARAVARIFWTDEELANLHFRRPLVHEVGSDPHVSDNKNLLYSNDLHELFMRLHGLVSLEEWLASGKHDLLYHMMYYMRHSWSSRQSQGSKRKSFRSGEASAATASVVTDNTEKRRRTVGESGSSSAEPLNE